MLMLLLMIFGSAYQNHSQDYPNGNLIFKKETQTPTTNEVDISEEVNGNITSDDTYKVSWIIARDKENISLFSNTIERLTSNEALINNNCKYLVNAGFVDKSNNHIGLFRNHDGLINESSVNNTFNGFLFIDNNRNAYISYLEPKSSLLALQTGPLLIKNNSLINLTLLSDKNSRRVVAAVNRNKELVFIVFYSKSNPLGGPRLSELPSMLEDLENNTSLNITDAVNLDGGSHSVYISDQIKLPESSIVGGYFCIKW